MNPTTIKKKKNRVNAQVIEAMMEQINSITFISSMKGFVGKFVKSVKGDCVKNVLISECAGGEGYFFFLLWLH